MNSGKLILGILAGLAAGAALGVLFAPDKGTETRRKITKKSVDLTDAVKEKINEFIDGIVDKYETSRTSTNKKPQEV
jgi:gas vesicle protein